MREPAVRSRLLQLRRDLEAARRGRDLLDRKREALLRAIAERTPQRDARRTAAATALGEARTALDTAHIELGRTAVGAAALAQPPHGPLHVERASVVGVPVPRVHLPPARFQPYYGPASGSWSLDRAGAAFAGALAVLLALASEQAALRALGAALARTARRLNAIDQVIIPDISHQIASIAAALEEEERDEASRRKQWLRTVRT